VRFASRSVVISFCRLFCTELPSVFDCLYLLYQHNVSARTVVSNGHDPLPSTRRLHIASYRVFPSAASPASPKLQCPSPSQSPAPGWRTGSPQAPPQAAHTGLCNEPVHLCKSCSYASVRKLTHRRPASSRVGHPQDRSQRRCLDDECRPKLAKVTRDCTPACLALQITPAPLRDSYAVWWPDVNNRAF
jgi:hypothetical protein